MGFSSWPVDAGSGKIRPVRFLGKIFFSCYIMTTKNNTTDKEMSIKVDLHDKYDRKALAFINGNTSRGLISIKKSFVDQRRKYSSTVTGPLKPKYSRPFKKARAKAEFNDFFALESNETKLSGRSWTTYGHDVNDYPSIKGHSCDINTRLNTLIPIAKNRMNHHDQNDELWKERLRQPRNGVIRHIVKVQSRYG